MHFIYFIIAFSIAKIVINNLIYSDKCISKLQLLRRKVVHYTCMFVYIFANAHTTRTTLYTFDGCETQFDLQSEWMFKYLSAKNNTHQIG